MADETPDDAMPKTPVDVIPAESQTNAVMVIPTTPDPTKPEPKGLKRRRELAEEGQG